jgi:hypothetical protein
MSWTGIPQLSHQASALLPAAVQALSQQEAAFARPSAVHEAERRRTHALAPGMP